MTYSVLKTTRENCTVGKVKNLTLLLVELEQTKMIEVRDEEELLYTLETIYLKRQLLCLIMDAITQPVRYSELERLGFVNAKG